MATFPSPVAIDASLASKIVCGEHVSAVVTDDGDLYTFGRGDSWQLGQKESEKDCPIPAAVPSLRGRVVHVALGADHTCIVDTSGKLFCYGRGSFSQLGLGDTSDRRMPTLVDGLSGPVVSVGAGWRFTLAVCKGGDVFSWGAGSTGQLGHPSKLRRRIPTKIEALDPNRLGATVNKVAAGETHSIALDAKGNVYAWGSNQQGRLGIGEVEEWGLERTTPTLLSSLSSVVMISAGNRHSACVTRVGVLYSWGCNPDGRLGNGTTIDACAPQKIILPTNEGVAAVSCGVCHTLALSASGRMFAWGCGKSGRLGVGKQGEGGAFDHENRLSPASVPLSDAQARFVDVAAGSNHNLAIQDTGQVVSWGALASVSNRGQLGLRVTEGNNSNLGANVDEFVEFGEGIGDSDTSEDSDVGPLDENNLQALQEGLVRTASSLSLRVKKLPPQLTGDDVLVGGADPHPALQTAATVQEAAALAASGKVKAGTFTPRPGAGGAKQHLAFPTEFVGETDLTALGTIKVHTPSKAKEKLKKNRHSSAEAGDSLPTQIPVQVSMPSIAVSMELENLQDENGVAHEDNLKETGVSPTSGIHPAKLHNALKQTMHNFAGHKFATLLKGLASAIQKQHLLAQASALCKWKLNVMAIDFRQYATSHVRNVKKGYDLLGSRLMYRIVCRLQQKILRRGFKALTMTLFTSRAAQRALYSTADARQDLIAKLKKMKEKEKLMNQRLQ